MIVNRLISKVGNLQVLGGPWCSSQAFQEPVSNEALLFALGAILDAEITTLILDEVSLTLLSVPDMVMGEDSDPLRHK